MTPNPVENMNMGGSVPYGTGRIDFNTYQMGFDGASGFNYQDFSESKNQAYGDGFGNIYDPR